MIDQTKEKFETIELDIEQVTENVSQQTSHMNHVNTSNDEIGRSIEYVSAFMEQLTASATLTGQISEDNLISIR